MKAIWNNEILADASETIVVDGNHYFPPESLHKQFLKSRKNKQFAHGKAPLIIMISR